MIKTMKSDAERKYDRIETELRRICFADIREVSAILPDFTFEDGTLKTDAVKSLSKLPKSIASAAASLKIKVNASSAELEIKLCDKFKALDMYLSLLDRENADSGGDKEHTFSVAYDYKRPENAAAENIPFSDIA